LSRRSYKELNKQDLQELITLSTEQAQRVFEYLGVKTQVYCLSISQKGQKFSRFIASQTFQLSASDYPQNLALILQ